MCGTYVKAIEGTESKYKIIRKERKLEQEFSGQIIVVFGTL